MKKIKVLCILCSLLVFFSYNINANEEECGKNSVIVQKTDLGNGIVKEVIIEEFHVDKDAKSISKKSGKKTYNYKNGSTILWSASVYGEFTYDGKTSSCTSAIVATSCPSSSWAVTKQQASKNGASAIATVTAEKYFLGICINTVNDRVVLTCDKNGGLS